ncbi:MAG: hypothetical protein U9O85_07170 [Euryarchaeota archaeon]|nr:hypothetical protein [Euryarchaeota archaeon]
MSKKKIVAVIVAVVVVAAGGVYLALSTPESGLSPAPDLDSGLSTTVEFSGTELEEETKTSIVSEVSAEVMPYKGVKYDKVNISAMKNDDDHDLTVICFSDACEYPDVYDFTYYGVSKQLVQNRYVLEAIPPTERAKAISAALQNEEAANLMRTNSLESVTPTVRRVLPGTAEKFYLPKTLLSVTWTMFGEKSVVVSVLVDPDAGKAVEVWSNLEVENKGGEM